MPNDSNSKKIIYLALLFGFTAYNIYEAKNKLAQSDSSFNRVKVTGDSLQVLIPIVALLSTLLANDNKAQQQFIRTAVITFAITHLFKHGVNAPRPNGGNRSFPSGHTSSAFQGAAFIHKRFGLTWALPTYLGATYVGYSRVKTKKHFLTDVIAGAILGSVVSHMGTSKK